MKKFFKSILWIIVVIVAFIVIANIGGGDDVPSATGDAITAFIMSEQFVEQRLKAPSTAKFSKYHEVEDQITKIGTNKWHVVAWVDAQNGFGAMIRNHYSCDMTYKGNDTWGCENLVIE